MRRMKCIAGLLGLLVVGLGVGPAAVGDSIFGRVTAVRRADTIVFDYGEGQYVVRLGGIAVPEQVVGDSARQFVARLVLGRPARLRVERRTPDGAILGRLLTADSAVGMNRDVGLELVRAGFARREDDVEYYKYGELAAAEVQARRERRGLWSGSQNPSPPPPR
jgi:endonuclease YncB( thermonuclease family)